MAKNAVDIDQVVGLIQALAPAMDVGAIQTAVTSWLNNHPEATTTVTDGSITEAKLAAAVAQKLGLVTQLSDDIGDLKSAINSMDGGTTGQVLRKVSGTNKDWEWASVAQPTDAQVENAVDGWLDDHPEVTTTVQDGSITEAKFTDTTLAALKNDYVTPEMFGAKGDGNTDDTQAIQAAVDYAQNNDLKLQFAKKTYKTTDSIIITKGININGNNCYINGTVDNKAVISINHDNEIRNRKIEQLNIRNYGTGNCLEINLDSSYSYISNVITGCSFHAANGWCLKVNERFAHNKVSNCTFSGNGIFAECGDANIFEKNTFFGQNSTGIYLNTPSYGILNNAIINNTIVNAGYAILIDSGDQTWICNNQIEYSDSSDSSNNPSAMLYIRGNTRSVKHCIIQNNNFGGGTHLDYDIYINCGDENIITGNRFVAVNISDIHVSNGGATGSTQNIFMDDNTSITQDNNPRTDPYQKVKVTAANPAAIIGCWHEIDVDNSTRKLRVRRNPNGIIDILTDAISHSSGTSHEIILTLPLGYRPTNILYVPVVYNKNFATPTEAILKIGYNGVVSFTTPQEYSSMTVKIPSFEVKAI